MEGSTDETLRQLVEDLYNGHWDGLIADLQTRLDTPPLIHRLVPVLKADIASSQRLRSDRTKDGASLSTEA